MTTAQPAKDDTEERRKQCKNLMEGHQKASK